jgi:hypothetical protein
MTFKMMPSDLRLTKEEQKNFFPWVIYSTRKAQHPDMTDAELAQMLKIEASLKNNPNSQPKNCGAYGHNAGALGQLYAQTPPSKIREWNA